MPLHKETRRFVEAGLFSKLSSFDELEARISLLDGKKRKGDAFEVFAEGYLATQRKHDAAQVWPQEATPTDVIGKLGLTDSDYGVDGVFRTVLGEFSAYQVKFRSGRKTLSWRELSTFIGLADSAKISSRILFTNSEEVPSLLNDRRGFFCIRGSDLDRLEQSDFAEIESWLSESFSEFPKKEPLPHQKEALDAIIPAFAVDDRITTIMACGTGKTLVTLWASEQMSSKTILVLLPSLALLRQTLHEWLHETSVESLAYLCVCSDKTVTEGLDAANTRQSDLDFEVLTEPENVRAFLDAEFTGTKVVFSTYQSAHIVGSAMKPGEAFELGIFDEAHKTAGREGRNYGFALDDENLPIRKRLFVTATPRHYNPHKRDREGESSVVFSMDNPAVYGAQTYQLSFGEAAARAIICNYKVVVTVITSGEVSAELLRRGDTNIDGDPVRSRQVANQIALSEAVEKYGVRKIFTFHKSVASAASFVSDGSEGVGSHLNDFTTFHVNGRMPTARRERVMKEFRSCERAVISNARCLTEGVDVPAVDMVAFLSPRRSRIDIVQAAGRAMRSSPGKRVGYILIPLYVELEQGESIEEAVDRSDFSEVWDVLQSLQEQDEVLADLIRGAAEGLGRGRGFDDQYFAERIHFDGVNVDLGTLRNAIATQCVERLSSPWDLHFGRLMEFKERFGHTNVVTGWEENPALASWVVGQRVRRKKGQLSQARIDRLDEVGFTWDYQDQKTLETWMQWYEQLRAYVAENGNADVPRRHANTKLASWVWIQRLRRGKHYNKQAPLSAEQEQLLNEIGFTWDPRAAVWEKNFDALEKFASENGHCNVGDNEKLIQWMKRQRKAYTNGDLDDERRLRLEAIGFSWDEPRLIDRRWLEKFERLKNYFQQHGNADVPNRWEGDPSLANWVSSQRERRKAGRLEAERIQLLDELEFTWASREVGTWEDRLEEVAAYKAKHGHCDIPLRTPENPKLGRFVNSMRTQHKSGKLSSDRVAKLNAIGFLWEHQDASWNDRYSELLEYSKTNGNCDVPATWTDNPALGHWVVRMRQLKKQEKLDPERVKLLEEIGFNWVLTTRGQRKPWEERLQDLIRYKEQHGDCNVPIRWEPDPELGGWVSRQRTNRKSGKIPAGQVDILDELGFEWSLGKEGGTRKNWDDRFADLIAYRSRHGDCNVPRRYDEDSQLGTWVSNQRSNRKRGKLTPEQESKLESIGFVWSSRNGAT